ncbi:hypothetical protein HDU97_000682 [Phlyctochytrium planicorne]|nr:hypothetical protein HDU97_000682 [Phlyctochytrium planicorne]
MTSPIPSTPYVSTYSETLTSIQGSLPLALQGRAETSTTQKNSASCFSLKDSSACPDFNDFSITVPTLPPTSPITNLADFDRFLKNTNETSPSFVSFFAATYACPNFTGTGFRYHRSSLCALYADTSISTCGAPKQNLERKPMCKDTIQIFLQSVQGVFADPTLCKSDKEITAVQRENRKAFVRPFQTLEKNLKVQNKKAFEDFKEKKNGKKQLTDVCFRSVGRDKQLCGFPSAAEAKIFCTSPFNHRCCARFLGGILNSNKEFDPNRPGVIDTNTNNNSNNRKKKTSVLGSTPTDAALNPSVSGTIQPSSVGNMAAKPGDESAEHASNNAPSSSAMIGVGVGAAVIVLVLVATVVFVVFRKKENNKVADYTVKPNIPDAVSQKKTPEPKTPMQNLFVGFNKERWFPGNTGDLLSLYSFQRASGRGTALVGSSISSGSVADTDDEPAQDHDVSSLAAIGNGATSLTQPSTSLSLSRQPPPSVPLPPTPISAVSPATLPTFDNTFIPPPMPITPLMSPGSFTQSFLLPPVPLPPVPRPELPREDEAMTEAESLFTDQVDGANAGTRVMVKEIVKKGFVAELADEMTLHEGNLVHVHRKFNDGWAYGTNLTTMTSGAFPLECLRDDVAPVRESILSRSDSVGSWDEKADITQSLVSSLDLE